MPKTKTRKSAAKRFRVSATGKVAFQPAGLRHNLETKSGASKRGKRRRRPLAAEHVAVVLRMLGRR